MLVRWSVDLDVIFIMFIKVLCTFDESLQEI